MEGNVCIVMNRRCGHVILHYPLCGQTQEEMLHHIENSGLPVTDSKEFILICWIATLSIRSDENHKRLKLTANVLGMVLKTSFEV